MLKNKKAIIIGAIIFILASILFWFSMNNKPDTLHLKPSNETSQFPPSNIQCFDAFMNAVDSGYADGFHIPTFNYSDISYFRCASKIGFDQYEISGKDKDGHTFYIHKDEGGMAASGADTVYNLCYKQDNIIIKNEKLNGREPIKKEGACFWTENFPQNPTSTYKFIK